MLRFSLDGRAEQVEWRAGHGARAVLLGSFRAYADTGRVRLLCFSFRRSRSQPACRYFEVDTLTAELRPVRRELRLLNWVDEGRTEPERWTERTP